VVGGVGWKRGCVRKERKERKPKTVGKPRI
jgi:hypothetical protein